MKKPETYEEMREHLLRSPEAWAEFQGEWKKHLSRCMAVMWHCIALHMEMIAEGTRPKTAAFTTLALYRTMILEINVEALTR
jgi:hypothetical protein